MIVLSKISLHKNYFIKDYEQAPPIPTSVQWLPERLNPETEIPDWPEVEEAATCSAAPVGQARPSGVGPGRRQQFLLWLSNRPLGKADQIGYKTNI